MIAKEKNFVSIVFIVRNNEKNVKSFLSTVFQVINTYFLNYEVICVNNASTDNSVEIVKKVFNLECNEGRVLNIINIAECISFEDAISQGVQFAIGDFIFEFDSLFVDYNPEMIYECYNEMLNDIDIVSLSPKKKRGFLQKMYYHLYNFGVEKNKRIIPERMRIISRRAINRVSVLDNSYSLNSSLYLNCGLKNKVILFKNKKKKNTYDTNEFNKRLEKAVETIFIYTKSFQRLVFIFSFLFLVSGIITFFFNYVIGLFLVLMFAIGISTYVILNYLHLELNLNYKKKIQLVKSIDKVIVEKEANNK